MPVAPDFVDHCSELLSGVGTVTGKRMFGGHGLYVDGVFIAIIVGDTMFLKTDDETRARFVDAGSSAFEYTARGETHSTGYFSVPADAMDSPHLMAPWARLAMEAALRAKTKPAKKKKPASRRPSSR
jgi:DNA transformation protein